MIKIFKMNECDWIAAESAQDALAELKTITDEEGIPEELTDADLDRLKFMDEDNTDSDGSIIPITFREQLNKMIEAGEKFPTPFASNEY